MLKSTPNPPRIHCEIHTRINTQILREGLFCIQAAVHHKAPALCNIVTANGPCKFKAWRLYGQDTSDFAAVQRRRQWPAPNTIDAPLHDAHGIGNAMDHGLATVGQGWGLKYPTGNCTTSCPSLCMGSASSAPRVRIVNVRKPGLERWGVCSHGCVSPWPKKSYSRCVRRGTAWISGGEKNIMGKFSTSRFPLHFMTTLQYRGAPKLLESGPSV